MSGLNHPYSPYGDTARTGTATTPLEYTGRENDGATGLYHFRARYYSPQMGRFISEDPIGLGGGTNYYAYVGGNPISENDPLGLLGADDIYGFIYDTTGGWTPSHGLIDYTTGFGDAASLNITSLIRDAEGTNDVVNKCSTAYRAGGWTTAAFGAGRLAYAGLAKGFSIFATSGAEASAARSALRRYFGGGDSLRPPNLTQYLRAAAGRTNLGWNLYGAGIAGHRRSQGLGLRLL